jgi:hypothetical protein
LGHWIQDPIHIVHLLSTHFGGVGSYDHILKSEFEMLATLQENCHFATHTLRPLKTTVAMCIFNIYLITLIIYIYSYPKYNLRVYVNWNHLPLNNLKFMYV